MKESSKKQKWVDIFKKQRGDWGEINPVTKVIPNKKKYKRKEKHPNAEE